MVDQYNHFSQKYFYFDEFTLNSMFLYLCFTVKAFSIDLRKCRPMLNGIVGDLVNAVWKCDRKWWCSSWSNYNIVTCAIGSHCVLWNFALLSLLPTGINAPRLSSVALYQICLNVKFAFICFALNHCLLHLSPKQLSSVSSPTPAQSSSTNSLTLSSCVPMLHNPRRLWLHNKDYTTRYASSSRLSVVIFAFQRAIYERILSRSPFAVTRFVKLFLCRIERGISPPMVSLLELMLPTVNAWSSLLCFID